jgi:CubicO group peptidase (beta-lactamase class C family)
MQVLDLLSHQSGIADLLGRKYHFQSVEAALDTAMVLPLDFEPGTKTVYAGGDYAVVMKLVETVSGMQFPEFMEQKLFRPLGMEHTGFNHMEQDYIYRTSELMPHAATVYQWDENREKQLIFSMLFPSWTYPSGGLFSSIEDLTKWITAIDTESLLSSDYIDSMWTPAKLRNGKDSDFGVGWIVAAHNGEKATGHSGGPALADIVRLPERKITAIVLTNQVSLRPFLTMKVLDMYLE